MIRSFAERKASFNLVIERLLISGKFRLRIRLFMQTNVSISLSSGFSFQAYASGSSGACVNRFNLVIERLLISGTPSDMHLQSLFQVSISLSSGFSFQARQARAADAVRNEFQSRYRAASHFRRLPLRKDIQGVLNVSISLSSGFSFQVSPSDFCKDDYSSFNLVIERLFISGFIAGDGESTSG